MDASLKSISSFDAVYSLIDLSFSKLFPNQMIYLFPVYKSIYYKQLNIQILQVGLIQID